MVPESVPGTQGISLIDTQMFGEQGLTAAYLFEGESSCLIDAGLYRNGKTVEEALDKKNIIPDDLDYLVISHLHLDHAGGITYLANNYSSPTVLCHPMTADYLTDPTRLEQLFESGREAMGAYAESYGEAQPIDRDRIDPLEDGDKIDLGDRNIEILSAPGHAPHQFCFYDSANKALHLVDEGCTQVNGELYPTTPPPDFDLEKTLDSLDRFIELDPDHLLYSHFGYRQGGSGDLETHKTRLIQWVELIEEYKESGMSNEEIIQQLKDDFSDEVSDYFLTILERDTRGVLVFLNDR